MKITLNGLDNPSNIITLSGCPTILTVNDSGYGDKAMLTIEVSNLNSVTEGNNIYIEINGERITSMCASNVEVESCTIISSLHNALMWINENVKLRKPWCVIWTYRKNSNSNQECLKMN